MRSKEEIEEALGVVSGKRHLLFLATPKVNPYYLGLYEGYLLALFWVLGEEDMKFPELKELRKIFEGVRERIRSKDEETLKRVQEMEAKLRELQEEN